LGSRALPQSRHHHQDEDFARRRALVEIGPSIVWIRLPNSRRKGLLDWFERVLPEIFAALDRGETIVEVV
jgi:predicted nuclease of predicted toxin-antitoxin system